MTGFLLLSEKACYKAQEQGKPFADAYLFCKHLSSIVKHPILFNFKRNRDAIRLLTGYSDHRFRKLLNAAIRFNLAYYEGDHLRIPGRQAERRLFNIKKRKHRNYATIKPEQIRGFYNVAVLKRNVAKQQHNIDRKAATKKGCSHGATQPTLSVRNISKCLAISIGASHALTKTIKGFGLCLTKNRQSITAYEYYLAKQHGDYTVRWDKDKKEYYRLGASIPTFTNVFKPQPKTYASKGFSYCNDLIG